MSNYPPGVTGNEYQISGAYHEWEEEFFCERCEQDRMFLMLRYGYQIWGDCSTCDEALPEETIEDRYAQDWDDD